MNNEKKIKIFFTIYLITFMSLYFFKIPVLSKHLFPQRWIFFKDIPNFFYKTHYQCSNAKANQFKELKVFQFSYSGIERLFTIQRSDVFIEDAYKRIAIVLNRNNLSCKTVTCLLNESKTKVATQFLVDLLKDKCSQESSKLDRFKLEVLVIDDKEKKINLSKEFVIEI